REAAFAGRIDDQQHLPLVAGEPDGLAGDVVDGEVVERGHGVFRGWGAASVASERAGSACRPSDHGGAVEFARTAAADRRPSPPDRRPMPAIAHLVALRERNLGSFSVRRLLPASATRYVGPFVF